MQDEDPKKIWQGQQTERTTMEIEVMREKARTMLAKTRRELFAHAAIAMVVFGIAVVGWIWTASPLLRGAFALAVAWAAIGQIVIHRGLWRTGVSGAASGVEFYRAEVRRRTALFGRVLPWSFVPVSLAILALLATLVGIAQERRLPLRTILPFSLAIAIWIVGVFVQRAKTRKALLRDIEESH